MPLIDPASIQPPTLTNPWALAGLLLIIPVILLYLLKPKPKRIRFPTIMFISRMEKDKRFRLFPKRFIRDPLLIIQILIITALILAITNPNLITKAEKKPQGDIVFILDASASMQATDIQPNRFIKAKEYAKKIIEESTLESTFNIILAENVPVIALRDGDRETTKRVLDQLSCADTPTNVGDSILFAKDMLSKKEGNKEIYVLSDYSTNEGLDIELASRITSKEDVNIKLIKVAEGGKNTAITDIDAKRFLTSRDKFYLTTTIQNLNPEESAVKIQALIDEQVIEEINEIIPAKSTKLLHIEDTLTADPHILTVKIKTEDDLTTDNTAYAVIPPIRKYSILLITDENSDTYLEYALRASPDITLTKAISPVIPEFEGFDTIIHGEINKELLLKGMYTELEEYVKTGGNLILIASADLGEIGAEDPQLRELMPIKLEWVKTIDATVTTIKDHEILEDTAIDDITLSRYYKAEAKENAETIVTVSGMPAIAYSRYEKGKVVYIGINSNPTWSNFYYSSSMPIFWYQLIRWVNKVESIINQQNHKTGDYLTLKAQAEIITPSNEKITASSIILDEVGVYTVKYPENQEQIAANLVNEKESGIAESLNVEAINKGSEIQKEKIDIIWDLYPYILGAALILLLIESIYYQKRGYFQK